MSQLSNNNAFDDLLKYLPKQERINKKIKRQIILNNMIYKSQLEYNISIYVQNLDNEIMQVIKTMMHFINSNQLIPKILLEQYNNLLQKQHNERDGYYNYIYEN
jgi:uncharacterized protein (DUF2344 family)